MGDFIILGIKQQGSLFMYGPVLTTATDAARHAPTVLSDIVF